MKTFSSRIWSGAFAEMLGLEGGSWQPYTCRCFVLGKNLFIESGVEEYSKNAFMYFRVCIVKFKYGKSTLVYVTDLLVLPSKFNF